MSFSRNERFDYFSAKMQNELDELLSMSNQPEMFLMEDVPGRDAFFRKMASHRDLMRLSLNVLEAIEEMHYPDGVPDA